MVPYETIQSMEGVSLQQSVRAQEQALKQKYVWYPKGISADMVIAIFLISETNLNVVHVSRLKNIGNAFLKSMCPHMGPREWTGGKISL